MKSKHRGSYYGFKGGHIEYHSVNSKKEKPADCIHMTELRICQNSKCPEYLRKCYVSSICKYRVKETARAQELMKITKIEPHKKEKIVSIKCSLVKGCPMKSRAYGMGKLVRYSPEKMIVYVDFDGKEVPFQYPNAIFDKYLSVTDDVYAKILKDKENAKIVLI